MIFFESQRNVGAIFSATLLYRFNSDFPLSSEESVGVWSVFIIKEFAQYPLADAIAPLGLTNSTALNSIAQTWAQRGLVQVDYV